MQKSKAFTLVELAIVITIIGLLIGGVLKGQELLENARFKSVVSQIKSFQTAYVSFQDIYKSKPGDMANATNFLQNCATNCANGNGDGSIGTGSTAYLNDYALTAENTQFWRHLSLANLLSGIDSQATALEWGKSNPATSLGGGFTIKQAIMTTSGTEPSDFVALALRLHAKVTGNTGANIENNGMLLTPYQTWAIDITMDDGVPYAGTIRASGLGVGVPPCEGTTYTASDRTSKCVLYAIMD